MFNAIACWLFNIRDLSCFIWESAKNNESSFGKWESATFPTHRSCEVDENSGRSVLEVLSRKLVFTSILRPNQAPSNITSGVLGFNMRDYNNSDFPFTHETGCYLLKGLILWITRVEAPRNRPITARVWARLSRIVVHNRTYRYCRLAPTSVVVVVAKSVVVMPTTNGKTNGRKLRGPMYT
jgi:hypothetical protein